MIADDPHRSRFDWLSLLDNHSCFLHHLCDFATACDCGVAHGRSKDIPPAHYRPVGHVHDLLWICREMVAVNPTSPRAWNLRGRLLSRFVVMLWSAMPNTNQCL